MNPQCQGWTKAGNRCRKHALTGSTFCDTHSLSEDELRDKMRKASRANVLKRRTQSEISEHRPLSGFRDGVTLQDVLDTCRPALTATFEHDGSPDWGARLLACLVLVQTFPRDLRATPEHIRLALEEALPSKHAQLADTDPLDYYRNARKEWIEKRLRYSRLTGLYVEEIPRMLVGPGEDRREIMRTEVPDTSGWEIKEFTSGDAVQVTKADGETFLVVRDTV